MALSLPILRIGCFGLLSKKKKKKKKKLFGEGKKQNKNKLNEIEGTSASNYISLQTSQILRDDCGKQASFWPKHSQTSPFVHVP